MSAPPSPACLALAHNLVTLALSSSAVPVTVSPELDAQIVTLAHLLEDAFDERVSVILTKLAFQAGAPT